MRRRITSVALTLLMVIAMATMAVVPIFAADSQDVTITATPAYIAIANSPATWTLNGLTGDGTIAIDTVYYANPESDTTAPSATVLDAECNFTITNTSTVATDLTVNCGHFSGGSDPMNNSDTGANGVGEYGAYSWCSGMTYASKVLMKTAASGVMKDGLAATTDIKWGAELETQTDAWAGGTSSTCTMTITATAD